MRRGLVAVLVALVVAGCFGEPSGGPPVGVPPGSGSDGDGPLLAELRFDGERAYSLVEEQVLRPDGSTRHRVPGTEGNREVAAWIAGSLEAIGFSASWHHFNATYGCEEVAMHNVIGERVGTSGRVVAFAAHYDTRPIAERDPDPARRDEPIAGANDGASGVAVLLELARVMPPTNDTVRLVFFDGEDGGNYLGSQCTDWILGSRAYAGTLSEDELAQIWAFVLVDMVGDHDLQLPRELNSHRALQDEVYAVAWSLGHEQFVDAPGVSVTDDHIPFVEAGVPAIDIIHLRPGGPWPFPETHHTHADDLENVSPDSLEVVGTTLEAWLLGLD